MELPFEAEILATRSFSLDEARRQCAELAEHLRRECSKDCSRCKAERHTFYKVEQILSDPEFTRWEEAVLASADDCFPGGLQGAGPDFVLGDLFDRYRHFLLLRNGAATELFTPRNVVGVRHMAKKRQTKKKIKKKKTSRKKTRRRVTKSLAKVLPLEPTEIDDDINSYSFFLHGMPLIGKTTLATAEGTVLVLSFDPLRPGLSIIQEHLPTWGVLLEWVRALEVAAKEDDFPYDRLVVDRIDLGYIRAMDAVCKKNHISHPSDVDWGRAWKELSSMYLDAIMRLMALPCGTWFICHSKWKEIKSRSGIQTERLVPDLSDRGEEILNGLTDGGFAYDWEGSERVIVIQGDACVTAGHNLDTAFKTPDGRAIVEVPAGESASEAWDNFCSAFNNEQKFIDLEERDKINKKGKGRRKKKKTLRKKVKS